MQGFVSRRFINNPQRWRGSVHHLYYHFAITYNVGKVQKRYVAKSQSSGFKAALAISPLFSAWYTVLKLVLFKATSFAVSSKRPGNSFNDDQLFRPGTLSYKWLSRYENVISNSPEPLHYKKEKHENSFYSNTVS